MSGRFEGKVGVVTGAAMGIGAAVASALVAEGCAVVLADRDERALQVAADRVASGGGRALGCAGDVTVAADARRFVDSAVENFGGLDVLVNNAGVTAYGEVPDFSEEDWDKVLGTNLKAQFLMAKYAVPEMRKRGGGAIVNVSSVQALASQRRVAAYAASKGGVVSFTRSLALDHAPDKIRVNAVLPGSVRTPMLMRAAQAEAGDPEETIASWGRSHPRGTVIEPEEIAAVVLFLLSDDASAVTGASYLADGGLSAQLPF